eukprot:CAMPEP_0194315228 /NCGR_PEP_ID=MMETSP0171-20130528/12027_1 /TAXON_ID=218684 /ORGANISM="Corethron pennatum, Strain L29A3" /LENGTH=50 /DNA_ID=CAMNT_0039070945 /DNA_START=199 /DNA_END=348 /DNA_ORIENTATION=+
MAVGINTLRAILCRCPSVLAKENITDADGSGVPAGASRIWCGPPRRGCCE